MTDFGDPWDEERVPFLRKANDIERTIACVNACADMDDPLAEIAALKAELAAAKKLISDIFERETLHGELNARCAELLAKEPEND